MVLCCFLEDRLSKFQVSLKGHSKFCDFAVSSFYIDQTLVLFLRNSKFGSFIFSGGMLLFYVFTLYFLNDFVSLAKKVKWNMSESFV